ncbi:hypothetical protein MLD38_039023 [Melastoma candidum]|uniref:Uncharacterized protein n=1 Tax=Melastoma candidum TaxID=119954 RepID=A0ACB9L1Y0_9MYRT|nr:hypothetical protein MLD38_039023 [Melastoma candidum]
MYVSGEKGEGDVSKVWGRGRQRQSERERERERDEHGWGLEGDQSSHQEDSGLIIYTFLFLFLMVVCVYVKWGSSSISLEYQAHSGISYIEILCMAGFVLLSTPPQ